MKKRTMKIISILTASSLFFATTAWALPQNGTVAAGASAITTPAANTLYITQTTDKAIINWQSYSIAAGEQVRYIQPGAGSLSLNRVVGADPSLIYGQLSANGQVWVINPNGLLVGSGATINVGSFLGSTLNINDEDFLQGNYTFFQAGSLSSIVNQGTFSAQEGGYVVLIFPSITNEGTIAANLGKAYLASGNEVNLTFAGNDLIGFTVDKETAAEALGITNKGNISANGGEVILSARAASDLIKTVIRNEGIIEAKTLAEQDGDILLLGGMENNAVEVGGTLDASAPDGGNGGFIETSAAKVTIKDGLSVSTAAPNGQTGTWLIDPQDFTIAATGGDMTGAAVTSTLATTSLEIQSAAGGTSGNGDIFVNDSITWTKNTLTLNAYRNIEINSTLYGSGTAGLALYYGQGASDGVISGTTATYSVNAPVNLATTGTFVTKLGSGGTPISYTILSSDWTDLFHITNLAGYYVLGADMDAFQSANYGEGLAYTPRGSSSSPFTGTFDGLGHTITGLYTGGTGETDNLSYVGLIGYNTGTIRNVGLVDSYMEGNLYIGGLAGYNKGTITNSYSIGTVKTTLGYGNGGGLVGWNDGGTITNCHSGGTVNGANGYNIGGLVGYSTGGGKITNSYSTADVLSARNYAGGLVGYASYSIITNSYSTGSVTDYDYVGGLVGFLGNSYLINSYSTASVNGRLYVGGLAGYMSDNTVTNSYSTGSVTGTSYVGGLVGQAQYNNSITNVYSTGSVTGTSYVGGLVGYMHQGSLTNAYSTGLVTGTSSVGGLVGYVSSSPTITASYWDTDTSGKTTSSGGTGKTTAQMQALSTFSAWSIDDEGGTTSTWRIYEGYTYPLLRNFLTSATATAGSSTKVYDGTATVTGGSYTWSTGVDTDHIYGTAAYTSSGANAGTQTVSLSGLYSDQQGYDIFTVDGTLSITKAALTVTASNDSKTYDANAYSGGNGVTYTGFVAGETSSVLGGSLAYGGTSQDAVNAGYYTITASGLTSDNYDIAYTAGALTINPATLTIAGSSAADKVYDGTTTATVTTGTLSGLVGTETLGISGTGTFDTKNAGTGKTVTAVYTLTDGTGLAANYTLASENLSADITPASLTVTANDYSRSYNGSAYSGGNGVTYTGFVTGETSTVLAGTLDYTGSSQGAQNAGTYVITPSGLASGNYSIAYANGALTITPNALTIAGSSAADKVYDGTTSATVTAGTLSGLVGTETLGISGTGTFDTKNVGTGKTVAATYTLSDGSGLAANYTLASENLTADISAKSLTAAYTGTSKTYDGTTAVTVTGSSYGIISGDTVTFSQSAAFADKNAGTNKTINVSSIALGGADAANYSLTANTATTTADITAATLTITGSSAADKIYDGTTTAYITAGTLSGLVGTETLTVNSTGTFDTKNVGTGKTVATSYALADGSGLAANYTLAVSGENLSADITPASLTVTANNYSRGCDGSAYSGGNGVTYNGFVAGETATVLAGTLTYTGSSQGAVTPGNYIITPEGLISGNYYISFADGTLTIDRSRAAPSTYELVSGLKKKDFPAVIFPQESTLFTIDPSVFAERD